MNRLRFAPSPTGHLHLGSLRTCLFNYLYAKHTNGQFILRFEDTDRTRSSELFIESIKNDLKWLGIDYDECYKQSERFSIYQKYAEILLKENKAYYCNCKKEDIERRLKSKNIPDYETKYDGFCRDKRIEKSENTVIRLNIGEDRDIKFRDIVKKDIVINTKELDDFILIRSDGTPTYNFAVVIDDYEMKINYIVRGEDHITNTAKQIILYEYLNLPIPKFAHLPMVLDKDKSPLSKRKGSTNIEYYRKQGIIPPALINYTAKLGWSYKNEEYMDIKKIIEVFELKDISKANAIYDEAKLYWLNLQHIKNIDTNLLYDYFIDFIQYTNRKLEGKMNDRNWLINSLSLIKNRHDNLIKIYEELLLFCFDTVNYSEETMKLIEDLLNVDNNLKAYKEVKSLLIKKNYSYENLESKLRDIANYNNISFGELVKILRLKLTGSMKTPDIISTIKLLENDLEKRL